MELFPLGVDVVIKVNFKGLPKRLSDYDRVNFLLISLDLKTRGQRQVLSLPCYFSEEGETEEGYTGTVVAVFKKPDQSLDMAYHVKVEFLDELVGNNRAMFLNAFLLYDCITDAQLKASLLLNSSYNADLAELEGSLIIGRGKSAYDIAVEQGYTGTEEEWLASLQGESAYREYVEWALKSGYGVLDKDEFCERLFIPVEEDTTRLIAKHESQLNGCYFEIIEQSKYNALLEAGTVRKGVLYFIIADTGTWKFGDSFPLILGLGSGQWHFGNSFPLILGVTN